MSQFSKADVWARKNHLKILQYRSQSQMARRPWKEAAKGMIHNYVSHTCHLSKLRKLLSLICCYIKVVRTFYYKKRNFGLFKRFLLIPKSFFYANRYLNYRSRKKRMMNSFKISTRKAKRKMKAKYKFLQNFYKNGLWNTFYAKKRKKKGR